MTTHPSAFVRILGASFLSHATQPVLAIGTHRWTRYDLARLGIPHLHAARHLDAIVQQLEIRTLPQLAERTDDICRLAGTGPTTIYVILALLAAAKIPTARAYSETVTVPTLKARQRRKTQLRAAAARQARAVRPSTRRTHRSKETS